MAAAWLSIKQLCEHFEVSRGTIQIWIDNGELVAVNHSQTPGGNRHWKAHVDQVRAFEQQRSSVQLPSCPPRRYRRRRPDPKVQE